MVRPQLEYCIQVRSPYLKQDLEDLEKVQRRATKMIQGYKDLSYEERLIRCGLTTLEKRRSRGDLHVIEAYKIITGKESIQWERFFELESSKGTRGHRYKLFKKRKGTLGQNFFSARVVDLWNELDDSPVSTGIFPHSLPEWAFRALLYLGFGGFAFALKLPELLNTNLPTVRAKLGQTSCFPNGPQIWFPIGQ